MIKSNPRESKCRNVPDPVDLRYFSSSEKQKDTVLDSFMKWLYDRFGVYIEDFRFQPEEQMVETEEPLSAKR